MRSAASRETQPQEDDADSQGKEADQAADHGVRQPGLDAGAGVATCQAAKAERDAGRPVRSHGAGPVDGQGCEGDDPCG